MKKILYLLTFILSGCLFDTNMNLDGNKSNDAKIFINENKEIAARVAKKHKAIVLNADEYQSYSVANSIKDPFITKDFFTGPKDKDEVIITSIIDECPENDCGTPPSPHNKTFMEKYDLNALSFVGTLSKESKFGLIRTPDSGIIRVRIGEYIGSKDGKIINIDSHSLIVHEKVFLDSKWRDRKTILMIK